MLVMGSDSFLFLGFRYNTFIKILKNGSGVGGGGGGFGEGIFEHNLIACGFSYSSLISLLYVWLISFVCLFSLYK